MAKIRINGELFDVSDKYAAELRASLLPNGEQLIRDLEPGEYEICGKKVCVQFDVALHKDYLQGKRGGYHAYIGAASREFINLSFLENYIGMKVADIRQHHIVRIEPKTGTELLDELEPGTLVAINGVRCAVTICSYGSVRIVPLFMHDKYAYLPTGLDEWQAIYDLSEAINKPVADLVEADIVQLYPKEA